MIPTTGDVASVSVLVRVPPAEAFAVFTEEIDLWWRSGPAFRVMGREPGKLSLEPGVGGKLREAVRLKSGQEKIFELGEVLIWEPPHLLEMSWRPVNFKEGEVTFVEVRFEASGEANTLVKLRHRGWAFIRADHPARHGETGAAFVRTQGLWWGQLMTSLRERIQERLDG